MCTIVTMSAKKREKSVPAGEFKAKCLAPLDEVEARGSSIVITKRGRPVARVVPLARAGGTLAGSLLHDDDLVSPVDVGWEASSCARRGPRRGARKRCSLSTRTCGCGG